VGRILDKLTLLLLVGLTLSVASPESPASAIKVENCVSGFASTAHKLIEIETRLSEDAVRRNAGIACDFVSDHAVAARAGATAFKTRHYGSRLEAAGVNVAPAESAVAKEVAAMRPNMPTGADVAGRLRIDNVLIEYRARVLPDGSISVGTIFSVL
jgi:hypothetical protein